MTGIVELEKNVFVAPQLVATDFAALARRGIRAVVNNRPDGEAVDQLPGDLAKAAARAAGLDYRALPVANLNVTDDDVVEAFAALLEDLPRPLVFYCRTGTRSSILWAQASVTRLGVERTLQAVAAAGYDLEPLRERLEELEEGTLATTPASAARGAEPALAG